MTIERALLAKSAQATAAAVYIEDVFSSWLRTGTGASSTVTNNIDIQTNGGLVITKSRSAATSWRFTDKSRGATYSLDSSSNASQATDANGLTAFTTSGYTVGSDTNYNNTGATYVDFAFRKQPKFFDVVTYTGTGSARTIAHNLGCVPGMIIVKRTDAGANWKVYHKGLISAEYVCNLNTTIAQFTDSTTWNSTPPSSSVFSVGTGSEVNTSGSPYVAYLFADSNSGGFGPAGTDSVVACGSFTTDGSGSATVNLGWEPQFLLIKDTQNSINWFTLDTMRGFAETLNEYIYPNNSNAAAIAASALVTPTATGFKVNGTFYANANQIYLAIRRGPMKTPTDATKVFYPQTRTANGTATKITGVGFAPDLVWSQRRDASGNAPSSIDKLRGPKAVLLQNSTSTEGTSGANQDVESFDMDGVSVGSSGAQSVINYLSSQVANWYFKRAPGFFDVVCYTGTGSATTVAHNLGVAPELMIVKSRNRVNTFWIVYSAARGPGGYLYLNNSGTGGTSYIPYFNNTAPTATNFTVGTGDSETNGSGYNFVAYLFATCPGVSKVGTVSGTGSNVNVDCGFASGARFVLLKQTNGTGSWFVFDTARGITSGNDPYLFLNETTAENGYGADNYIQPYASGFTLTTALITTGQTFLYLAIA